MVETEKAAGRTRRSAACVPLQLPGSSRNDASLYLRSELRSPAVFRWSISIATELPRRVPPGDLERFRPGSSSTSISGIWRLSAAGQPAFPIVVDFCDWPLDYLESAAPFRSAGARALLRHERAKVLASLARLSRAGRLDRHFGERRPLVLARSTRGFRPSAFPCRLRSPPSLRLPATRFSSCSGTSTILPIATRSSGPDERSSRGCAKRGIHFASA